ncbi:MULTISPECIES: (2Fe-2S)-binding protein [Rhizobium]|uniref:(2Fe-2S)-binding protein n=1 Tax=Rhizobium tropici TaxID=398 RepID=A0A6P1C4W7_RHITR|nr:MULTISPECIES: (2Fe-2S)-binding protein [Rhizobium]AGB74396.1 carbon monoxide dehydrogenase small chain [Rhizobium tropici CIAT 899]MBB4240877.1 carbon-monoxide dehydrogenase small subunit [Rhizobium tropici]MBB5591706.1 carbon-monoxide dehydrogenase small subunit [Rhizobium tropici]MBB6490760.1 carbon-monoxide dehydrogenase small subunit [Rhizobium tropici]NEV12239.1 (2Fe-2S)-binding protein [Rhizobium tropici]
MTRIEAVVNGKKVTKTVDDNRLLVTFLREDLGLTGTHVGCDTTQCGACVVNIDGDTVKSCTSLAAGANGCSITTIEGVAHGERLHRVQEAFHRHHALQCGYCTPGLIITAIDIIEKAQGPLDEATVRQELKGNLCRCTGYQNIVSAILDAAEKYAMSSVSKVA